MNRTAGTFAMVATMTAVLTMPLAARAAQPNPAASSNVLADATRKIADAESLTARAQKATGALQDAISESAEAKRATAEALKKQAAAFDSGDDEALKATGTEVNTARKLEGYADTRQSVQEVLARINPNENLAVGEADKALLDAYLAARQKVMEGGEKFLAAITPEASQGDVEVARDAWIQCQDDISLTRSTLDRANDRARMAAWPGAADPAAASKLAEMAKIDEEMLAAQKTAKAQNLQARILERKRSAAQREFDTAIRNARNAPKQ